MAKVPIAIIYPSQEGYLTRSTSKVYSPSAPIWEAFDEIEYTDQLSDLWHDPEIN